MALLLVAGIGVGVFAVISATSGDSTTSSLSPRLPTGIATGGPAGVGAAAGAHPR